MLRREQTPTTAAVGLSAAAPHEHCDHVHSGCFHHDRLRPTPEPARASRHGRRRHCPEQHRRRQPLVCHPATDYPGRETRPATVFPTAVTISTPLVCPPTSASQNLHAVAFPVDGVHIGGIVHSDHKSRSDFPTVDTPVTNLNLLGSRPPDASDTTDPASPTVRHGPGETCGDVAGPQDIGMVLRGPLLAGIGRSTAVNFTRDIPGEGFFRSQVPVLTKRPDREGAHQRASALCLRSVPAGRRAKTGAAHASVRVRGPSGRVLHRGDEGQCAARRCRWGETGQGKQGLSPETQGASVGGRQRAHVLSHPSDDASVQETATPISAACGTFGHQQVSQEGYRTTAVFLKERPFCCRSNIPTAVANSAYGLSEGVPLLPLTGIQPHVHDNQSDSDAGGILAGAASVHVTNSNTVDFKRCILGRSTSMAGNNCRRQDAVHKQLDGLDYSPVTHLSSMKAVVTIVRCYVAFVILLMEIFTPQRTKQIYKYEDLKNHSEVLELSPALDYVCKSIRKNCGYLLAGAHDDNSNNADDTGYRMSNVR